MTKRRRSRAATLEPLPLRERHWNCQNCNMRVFWSFRRDRYVHTESKEQFCRERGSAEVAHPRIRQ